MAYSDYGGYAYRNGKRVIDRSDATITPDGDIFGTPGQWPGFEKYLAGVNPTDWPEGHVIIGDGHIYVALYKQSSFTIYRGFAKVPDNELFTLLHEDSLHCIATRGDGEKYIDPEDEYCRFMIDGHELIVYHEYTDNKYQYAMLKQPDGVVWCGWSGYGVGAGLEDGFEGYSTDDCEVRIEEIFPQAFLA